jgi:hypothetical protein
MAIIEFWKNNINPITGLKVEGSYRPSLKPKSNIKEFNINDYISRKDALMQNDIKGIDFINYMKTEGLTDYQYKKHSTVYFKKVYFLEFLKQYEVKEKVIIDIPKGFISSSEVMEMTGWSYFVLGYNVKKHEIPLHKTMVHGRLINFYLVDSIITIIELNKNKK